MKYITVHFFVQVSGETRIPRVRSEEFIPLLCRICCLRTRDPLAYAEDIRGLLLDAN